MTWKIWTMNNGVRAFEIGEPHIQNDPIPEAIRQYLRNICATAHRQLVKGRERVIDGMGLRLPRGV
jgi:hypothetical protein